MPFDIENDSRRYHPLQRPIIRRIWHVDLVSLVERLLIEADSDAYVAYVSLKTHIMELIESRDARSEDGRIPAWYIPGAIAFLDLIRAGAGCYELCDATHQKRSGWRRSQLGQDWLCWTTEERAVMRSVSRGELGLASAREDIEAEIQAGHLPDPGTNADLSEDPMDPERHRSLIDDLTRASNRIFEVRVTEFVEHRISLLSS